MALGTIGNGQDTRPRTLGTLIVMAVVGCVGLITRPNVDDAIDGTKLDLLTCCQHETGGHRGFDHQGKSRDPCDAGSSRWVLIHYSSMRNFRMPHRFQGAMSTSVNRFNEL